MFWTAWPDAPLTRLSSAEAMMARPLDAVATHADEGHVGARTWRVCGISPNGSTWTNGSSR